jgi:hypothetical protein
MSAPADLPTEPSPDALTGAAKDADYPSALKELAARSERFKTASSGRLNRLAVSKRQFDALVQREDRIREGGRLLSVFLDANSAEIQARDGGC